MVWLNAGRSADESDRDRKQVCCEDASKARLYKGSWGVTLEQYMTRSVLQRRQQSKIVQGEVGSNIGRRRDKMCLAKTPAKRDCTMGVRE